MKYDWETFETAAEAARWCNENNFKICTLAYDGRGGYLLIYEILTPIPDTDGKEQDELWDEAKKLISDWLYFEQAELWNPSVDKERELKSKFSIKRK